MIPNIFISALCALTACTASPLLNSTYPNPEPCTGNCTWVHDPSIIRKDSTYYRFSTSGNIAIATAPSLTGPWEYQGPLLENGTSITVNPSQDIWAPDVSRIGTTYYAYYSVSTFGSQTSDIGLATSPSLDPGSWTDHGSIHIPPSPSYNLIDPNIFQDPATPDADPWLVFGSYWDGVFQTPLTNLTSFTAGDSLGLQNVLRNSTTATAPFVIEGAFQFRRQSLYYLFFSSGACCNTPPDLPAPGAEYRIMVCRASAITGPYVDDQGRDCVRQNGGTEVLGSHGDVYAPGGQGVLEEEEDGRVVLYYHYGE